MTVSTKDGYSNAFVVLGQGTSAMSNRLLPVMPVIIAGCVLLLLSFGYRAGFGLFLQPISEARGWGRDVLSLALAIQNLAWGIFAVIAGGLADRYGQLRVLLGGVCCYALGIIGMAHAADPLSMIGSAGLLVGAGISGTAFGIVLPALARAVPEDRRGWALGLGTASGSLGQFLVVPFMQELINFAGWFTALHILGLSAFIMAVLAIPLAPYGGSSVSSEPEIKGSLLAILRRALGSRSYRLLAIGFFVCGFHLAFISVHMPSYLLDLGFDARVGAWSISLIGLCNVVGAYVSGTYSGRIPKKSILCTIYGLRVVALTVFLVLPVTLGSVLVFSAAMGFLWLATVPPTTGLVATFFGTRYMTFLYGIVFLSHQLGGFIGVWLGGWLYELQGHYDGMWVAGILFGLIAVALHWPIQERDERDRLQAA